MQSLEKDVLLSVTRLTAIDKALSLSADEAWTAKLYLTNFAKDRNRRWFNAVTCRRKNHGHLIFLDAFKASLGEQIFRHGKCGVMFGSVTVYILCRL